MFLKNLLVHRDDRFREHRLINKWLLGPFCILLLKLLLDLSRQGKNILCKLTLHHFLGRLHLHLYFLSWRLLQFVNFALTVYQFLQTVQLLRLKHLHLISHLHRWVWLRQHRLDRWELLTVDEWHELASYSLVPWLILRCLLSKVFLVFTKWSVIHAEIFFCAALQLVQIQFWYTPLVNIKLGRCFKWGTRSLWLLLDREDLIIESGRKLGMVDLALLHQLRWAHL